MSWLSTEDLGALVRRHRIDDSVNKAITRATNVDVICIDDTCRDRSITFRQRANQHAATGHL